MEFILYAKGSGKFVRVVDRIAKMEVFNRFIDAETEAKVVAASPNGLAGNIDVYKALTAPPNIQQEVDYDVKKNEVLTIED